MKLLNVIKNASELVSAHGLSDEHLLTLLYIYDRGGVGLTKLATLCGVSTAAVTRRIDRLEKAGWVKRVRLLEDRRAIEAQVTDEGEAAINDLIKGIKADNKKEDQKAKQEAGA